MMPSLESSDLRAYVDQLAEATRNGSIKWRDANPTTFIYETGSVKPAGLMLQRLERAVATKTEDGRIVPIKKFSYRFYANEGPVNRLTIDSSGDAGVNQSLETLFELIKSEISRETLDFLKSILPAKSNG
jgi:hypothetical protein